MAALQKLAISGIRSFDHMERETIEFYSPLTLIVGHNGSGKTTIIESLRYATTGEMPPNSKGGAFIHDPSIAGEKEVKAQVKLGFTNTNGQKMVASRSLLLTVKKTAKSMKTLEGQLVIYNGNERTTLSSKCAEMDVQMALSLGVSKAVLENVLFCHQEDSNWPLSEPAVLKKKFDEIFEAMRYTKAIDQLKHLRKDQAVEIKLSENTLEHLKTDKERATKVQKQSEALLVKITTGQERVKELDAKIKDATEQSDALFRSGQAFQQVLAELDRLKQQKKTTNELMIELKANMKVYKESDEELLAMKNDFRTRVDDIHTQAKNKAQEKAEMVAKQLKLRKQFSQKVSRQGSLKSEAEAQAKRVKRKAEFIQNSLSDVGGEINHDTDFQKKLEALISKLTSEISMARNKSQSQERDLTDQISELKSVQGSLGREKEIIQKNIETNNSDISRLQRDIDNADFDEGEIGMLTESLNDEKHNVESCKTYMNSLDFDNKNKTLEGKIRQLDFEIEQVNNQIRMDNQQSDERAKLKVLKRDFEKRKSGLSAFINANNEAFQTTTGKGIVDSNPIDVKTMISSKQQELVTAQSEFDRLQKTALQLDARYTLAAKTQKEKKDDLTKSQQQIKQICNGDYPSEVEKVENAIREKMKTSQGLKFGHQYFDKSVEIAMSDEQCCQLCLRDFEDANEVEAFCRRLRHQIANLPTQRQSLREEIVELEEKLQELKEAAPMHQTIITLKHQLPSLESEFDAMQTALKEAHGKVSERLRLVDALKQQVKDLESMSRLIQESNRYTKDIDDLQKDITQIETFLESHGIPPEDLQVKLDDFQQALRTTRKDQSVAQQEKDKIWQRLSTLTDSVRKREGELNDAQHKVEAKGSTLSQIMDLKTATRLLSDDLITIQKKDETLNPTLSQFEEQLQELSFSNDSHLHSLSDQISKLETTQFQLTSLNHDISAYQGDEALAQCERDVIELSSNIDQLDNDMSTVDEQIRRVQENVSHLGIAERTISDNIRARRLENDLKSITEKISQLETKNAESDRDQYKIDSEKLKAKYSRLVAERAGLLGETKQMDDQLKRYSNELDTEYENIHDNYRRQNIKVRTTKAANEDLGKYGKALDK